MTSRKYSRNDDRRSLFVRFPPTATSCTCTSIDNAIIYNKILQFEESVYSIYTVQYSTVSIYVNNSGSADRVQQLYIV